MTLRPKPLHLRIFLSSPGDVAEERRAALQLFERLQYDPLLRGRITIEAVAWDKPNADAVMLATMTPQEAVNAGLPKPSECDIVVVMFWARMGTLLPPNYTKPDGSRYRSGTEWEYEDGIRAARATGVPKVIVYRRMEKVTFSPQDPDFNKKVEQWQEVEAFFAAFVNPDESIRQGYNQYNSPAEFAEKLETHLKQIIKQLLEAAPAQTESQSEPRKLEAAMPAETKNNAETEVWAKISLPASEGLRGELPAVVPSGDVIQKDDARATTFPIRFPTDPKNGQRMAAPVVLKATSTDLLISAPGERVAVDLPPDSDSRTVIFTLEPKPSGKTSGRARIFIDLIYEEKVIAQISVSTQLVGRVTASVKAWNLAGASIAYSSSASGSATTDDVLRGGLPKEESFGTGDAVDLAEPPLDDEDTRDQPTSVPSVPPIGQYVPSGSFQPVQADIDSPVEKWSDERDYLAPRRGAPRGGSMAVWIAAALVVLLLIIAIVFVILTSANDAANASATATAAAQQMQATALAQAAAKSEPLPKKL